jgi:hypothetical protein
MADDEKRQEIKSRILQQIKSEVEESSGSSRDENLFVKDPYVKDFAKSESYHKTPFNKGDYTKEGFGKN